MLCPRHTIPEYFPSFHHHANLQNIGSWNNEQMRGWISWILLLGFHPQPRYSVNHLLLTTDKLALLCSTFCTFLPTFLCFCRSMVTLRKAVTNNTTAEQPFNCVKLFKALDSLLFFPLIVYSWKASSKWLGRQSVTGWCAGGQRNSTYVHGWLRSTFPGMILKIGNSFSWIIKLGSK